MNKVFINNDNIVECQVVGDQTAESIAKMGKQISELLVKQKSQGLPKLILDDITKIGEVSPEGRQAVVQFVKDLKYDRLVMLGNNGLLRFGANLIFRATGRSKKMKYFTSRSDATAWLLEQK